MAELRLGEHFPRKVKECKQVTEDFFACFSQHSELQHSQDRDAGRRGLAACAKQMEQYDKCMAKYWQKKPEKLYRVQEEYRAKREQASSPSA